jgi:hypothetical protein
MVTVEADGGSLRPTVLAGRWSSRVFDNLQVGPLPSGMMVNRHEVIIMLDILIHEAMLNAVNFLGTIPEVLLDQVAKGRRDRRVVYARTWSSRQSASALNRLRRPQLLPVFPR